MDDRTPTGHRSLPRPRNIRIEAWAPDRERCVAEAVGALVHSFADTSGTEPDTTLDFRVEPGPDEDLLVGVLDHVLFLLNTAAQVPVVIEVTATGGGGLRVRLRTADTDQVTPVGPVPGAVSLDDLRFGVDGAGGWSCSVTLDLQAPPRPR